MNEKLLQEYVSRMGLVTTRELAEQTGVAQGLWRKPALKLIEQRELFLSRFDHGEETILSKHLIFCLRAVFTEPYLSPEAQSLYDFLSDNEMVLREEIIKLCGLPNKEALNGFHELQRKLAITPMLRMPIGPRREMEGPEDEELSFEPSFLWVTDGYWMNGLTRPARYKDLEYCLSEIRRILRGHFSTREINGIIYHSAV